MKKSSAEQCFMTIVVGMNSFRQKLFSLKIIIYIVLYVFFVDTYVFLLHQ